MGELLVLSHGISDGEACFRIKLFNRIPVRYRGVLHVEHAKHPHYPRFKEIPKDLENLLLKLEKIKVQ
jgi:hypothetical protein